MYHVTLEAPTAWDFPESLASVLVNTDSAQVARETAEHEWATLGLLDDRPGLFIEGRQAFVEVDGPLQLWDGERGIQIDGCEVLEP